MSLNYPENTPQKSVRELISHLPELEAWGKESDFRYISADSRKCRDGIIFCLYEEYEGRGFEFIKKARDLSTNTVVLRKDFYVENPKLKDEFPTLCFLTHPENPRFIHGEIASFCLDFPSRKLEIIAVTGTNGKTSVTSCLYKIFLSLQLRAGLIGTISVEFGSTKWESINTTPDPSLLQLILHEMVIAGVRYVFMEASSHGLKLNRMDGTAIRGGIFTNLTPDHLDFHKDMTDYLQSKFRLFQLLENSKKGDRFGILSEDSPGGKEVLELLKGLRPSFPVHTLGKKGTFSPSEPRLSLYETSFSLNYGDSQISINTKLLGHFNFINLSLVFICASLLLPSDRELILRAINELEPVVGRFEIVSPEDRKRVGIVDYAHTPDALENVLKSIQEIPHSKLICVFGCGGDRDKTKRPVMGEIACKYADFVFITSDNPRTEDPTAILREIESGIQGKYSHYTIIPDRREAIQKAVEGLPENGFLLVAGKGHENYQIIGTTKYPFSDVEELKKAFSN